MTPATGKGPWLGQGERTGAGSVWDGSGFVAGNDVRARRAGGDCWALSVAVALAVDEAFVGGPSESVHGGLGE